jgi:hypothetical protein
MWKSAGCAPSLRVFLGICHTTEEKARKNLSLGKENLSQVKKNLSQIQYTYYQNAHTNTLQNPHAHAHYKTI